MKWLRKFNESEDYLKSEEFYKDLVDRLFIEIDEYFKERNRKIPLCIKLDKVGGFYCYNNDLTTDINYSVSICLGSGWSDAISYEEENWLNNKLNYYRVNWGLYGSLCGNSYSRSMLYFIDNDLWIDIWGSDGH